MPKKRKYKYHQDGTLPEDGGDWIFVFGSNTRGIHGKGAAVIAKEQFGAVFGTGVGLTGKSFAIPTKDRFLRSMSLAAIKHYAMLFVDFTCSRPDLQFWVTSVGCGLAGYKPEQIAPFFIGSNTNCNFPKQWAKFIEPK